MFLSQAAGQMLLDDWRPGSGHEWFDASRQGWLYHDSGKEAETEQGGATGHELVLQTLSDASGALLWDACLSENEPLVRCGMYACLAMHPGCALWDTCLSEHAPWVCVARCMMHV